MSDTGHRVGAAHDGKDLDPTTSRWSSWRAPLLVCLLTGAYAMVPAVFGASDFYLRGDSAAQFLPSWIHLGQLVRSGVWPPVLDPTSWQGGNYAAEALLGVYNPLHMLNWVVVSLIPDLAVAAALVKAEFLVLLALGVYLLCREYGATRWAASVVAVALPFSGYTLYWDTAAWASGLMAFAYVPHVWWSLRKVAGGRLNPVWAFLVGALAITQGNPYGVLGVLVVGTALVVEAVLSKNRTGLRRLVLTVLCVAALIPLVFWPLLDTVSMAPRSDLPALRNSGLMRPNPGDLLNLAFPTYVPGISTIVDPMRVPAVYFAWFALPLLPWLRWNTVRTRWRELSGVGVLCLCYLLLTLTPSKLWLFRWPLRLIEYLHLGLGVALALLLSAGLHRGVARGRVAASFALGVAGFYLSWAQTPMQVGSHALALLLVVALTAALLWSARRMHRSGPAALLVSAQLGTLAVLCLQLGVFPYNASSSVWNFPHSVPAMRSEFSSLQGTTIQFAKLDLLREKVANGNERIWSNFLGGSMYHAIGVQSVNTYSGIGLERFTNRLCLDHNGSSCARGYYNLWRTKRPGRPNLATLMKLQTIVLERSRFPYLVPAPRWHRSERSRQAVVLTRDSRPDWPHSRLSWVSRDVDVSSARTTRPTQEVVDLELSGDGPSRLVFARLAWPGYQAQVDGQPAAIHSSTAGLLEVELPPGISGGRLVLTFQPPGFTPSVVLAGVGLLGALALGVPESVRRRLRPVAEQPATRPGAPSRGR